MGLTQNNSHLSQTAHPFCSGLCPNDIRLTTHYNEKNFLQAFLATMHEAGHALYEAGLPMDHFGTPLCEAASHGIHESQSRIWETCIGHSKPFWKGYYPHVQKAFHDSLSTISSEDFTNHVNFVKPSLIRIFSDEVTYNLHIILRYEIEKQFLDGTIDLKTLPELWNEKMNDFLGIVPDCDRNGVLQDIHWSLGLIGYFPSYTLGNLYAGALFQALKNTHFDFDQKVSNCDFTFINNFLKNHIHQYGREFSPKDLIEKAIGKTFTADPYIAYLSNKYQIF